MLANLNLYLQVRMNFSHGEYSYHQSVIDNTRKMLAGKFIMSRLCFFFCGFGSLNPQPTHMAVRLPLLLTLLVLCYPIFYISYHASFRLQKGPEIRTGAMRDGIDVGCFQLLHHRHK